MRFPPYGPLYPESDPRRLRGCRNNPPSLAIRQGICLGASDHPEPDDLDRHPQRQPVLLVEIELGQLFDPGQTLSECVRVQVKGPRRTGDAAQVLQVSLQGAQERCAAALLVVDQPLQSLLVPVPYRALSADHVAVGAELLIRKDAGSAP